MSDPAQFALPFLIEPTGAGHQRRPARKAPNERTEKKFRPSADSGVTGKSRSHNRPTEPSTNVHENGKRKQKGPNKTATETVPLDGKILVSRKTGAHMLSISVRAVDYLIATKKLATRRIGTRVMIPVEEIRRFARSDHPDRMAG